MKRKIILKRETRKTKPQKNYNEIITQLMIVICNCKMLKLYYFNSFHEINSEIKIQFR